MNNIYVGWDSREDIAYQVCEHSILNRSKTTEVIPLKQKHLRDSGIYTRDIDKLGSTEFTFTRFLVPFLNNYEGWAIFCDCDMVFLSDAKNIFDQADDKYAVMCVQHDYTPPEGHKMDGQLQLQYPRKNWSSMVLFNCGHPSNKKLTKELINDPSITGKYLHRFSWLEDSEIGELSHEYNWLVGWYKEPKDGSPKVLHYTEGGPWFDNMRDCEYSDIWKKEVINLYSSQ
jgi:lipopolysaccharide biosynthesis glycosyltransferase